MSSVTHRLYRHIETNKVYYVLNDHVFIEKTMERAVVCARSQPETDEDRIVWVIPYKEFMSDLFKPIKLKE